MTYLFDFDGTLVDSMPTYGSQMLRILEETGTPYPDDVIKIITPLGYVGTAKYYLELGMPLSFEEITERMGRYMYEQYANNIPAKDTVRETLLALRARGDKLNVLTASRHEALDPCLTRLGIFDIFDNVWSCDDFGMSKSNPEIYILAAERLGKSVEDVIFVDDNIVADQTAKSVGMTVYGVYDDSSQDYIDDLKVVCDRYIYSFSELI